MGDFLLSAIRAKTINSESQLAGVPLENFRYRPWMKRLMALMQLGGDAVYADRLQLLHQLPSEKQPGQFAVRVMFTRQGALFEEDLGYLRFEEGSLFFEGLQSAFSIARDRLTLAPEVRKSAKGRTRQGIPNASVRLRYEIEGEAFGLAFLSLDYEAAEDRQQRLRRRFLEWKAELVEPPLVEVLPPRTPLPGAARRSLRGLMRPILAIEAFSLITLVFLLPWRQLAGVSGLGLSPLLFAIWFPAGFGLWSLVVLPVRDVIHRYRLMRGLGA